MLPLTKVGWPEDPDKGKPFRHARARARLMLAEATTAQRAAALDALIERRPNDVLDALIEAVEPEEARREG